MDNKRDFKLIELLSGIRKRLWLVIIITILSTLTSAILSYYGQRPVYKSSTSILVGKNSGERITASDVVMYQNLSKTYIEIARTRRVAEIASERLNDGTSASDIQASIEVNSIKDTQVIKISAEGETAKSAADRATIFSETFVEESQRLLDSGNARIIDKALTPNNPVNANQIQNIAVAFLIGLVSSIIIVLFLEYVDNTIKFAGDIGKYIDKPVVGVIPKTKGSKLIIKEGSESLIAQAYRTLRTNIQLPANLTNIKILLVTSSGIKEGKTTVARNLGITIAQSGKKVLVIDCDIRKPELHKIFNVSNKQGLSDALIDNKKIDDLIINISENFNILTAGEMMSNFPEILLSSKMNTLLEELQSKYDNIIIDSPSVLSVTDVQVLSTKVNGVLYVVSSYQSSIEEMKKSIELLKTVNANIIGVVLNKTDYKFESLNSYFNERVTSTKGRKKAANRLGIANNSLIESNSK